VVSPAPRLGGSRKAAAELCLWAVLEERPEEHGPEREIRRPVTGEGAFAQIGAATRTIHKPGGDDRPTAITTNGHLFSLLSWDIF